MKVSPARLPGVLLIEPDVYGDERGFFLETWSQQRYAETGVPTDFVQDNVSRSCRDTLRGLHLQQPHAQGKLVHVLEGEVFDVVVDVRVGSPTFGRWIGAALSAANHRQIYIPAGFAHGFCVRSDSALFAYKCTQVYHPETEIGIAWNDPDLAIMWPTATPRLSAKDGAFERLRAIDPARLPRWEEPRRCQRPLSRCSSSAPDGMLGRAWSQLLSARGIGHQPARRNRIDLGDPASIAAFDFRPFRTIVNCAAWTDVDRAEDNEQAAAAVNGVGVRALAERVAEAGCTLIHYSSDYVFEGTRAEPYPVDARLNPLGAYGRSKAEGERGIRASGARHLVVRTSWLYAPWGRNFVRTIAALARSRPELRVVNDQRGRPTSAEHLADATLRLLDGGADGTWHVTDAGECTWFDFATEIAARTNPECRVRPCSTADMPRPARRPAYSVLDIAATVARLGPMPHWTENLASVLDRMEP